MSIVQALKDNPQWMDETWRLNNLYFIKNKQGEKVRFQPNWAQKLLYNNMWYLNIILKARQLGMTTFIQILFLDRCLFNENTSAGVIAHNKEDAEAFFDDKIKFAYDNLPSEIREALRAKSDNRRELAFSNGSKIRVGTSMRSGTLQYLHISEFGKLCAKFPEKAKEVITGSLNTVAAGQFIFIESTAEGDGKFKDMFNHAWHNPNNLTQMDYRAHFFGWQDHPDYVLEGVTPSIDDKMREYFEELEKTEGISLTTAQKAWYVAKASEQGDEMKQEYPATPAEAFSKIMEGVILAAGLLLARKEGRICKLPINRSLPVHTFWDLGRDDKTAIWFGQENGPWFDWLYYYEYRLQGLEWYAKKLADVSNEKGWVYGTHYLPHDGGNTDISVTDSRQDILERLGVRPSQVVERITVLNDGIELMRGKFSTYRFDEEGCAEGIAHLENYMWTQDKEPDIKGNVVFRKTPRKNGSDHCADALRQHAQGYRGQDSTWTAQLEKHTQPQRAYMRGRRNNPLTNPSTAHIL